MTRTTELPLRRRPRGTESLRIAETFKKNVQVGGLLGAVLCTVLSVVLGESFQVLLGSNFLFPPIRTLEFIWTRRRLYHILQGEAKHSSITCMQLSFTQLSCDGVQQTFGKRETREFRVSLRVL
jgi:hypothetical protein